MIKKIFILLFASVTLFWGCTKTKYEFVGTDETFEIFSTAVEDDYFIYVYLPSGYSTAESYPLIIGLDADAEFYTMEDIVSHQIINKKIPPSIFVGIGYGSVSKNQTLRNRDYTPTFTEDGPPTGGAANFYTFIKDELLPELYTKYSIDSTEKHTLMGHSYGGLFSFYALFQDPSENPFDKFVPAAASFWYDAGELFKYQENYFEKYGDLTAKVYATMGSLEGAVMVNSFHEMKERFASKNYSNLVYEFSDLKRHGHSRADYISYEKGLEYVFNH